MFVTAAVVEAIPAQRRLSTSTTKCKAFVPLFSSAENPREGNESVGAHSCVRLTRHWSSYRLLCLKLFPRQSWSLQMLFHGCLRNYKCLHLILISYKSDDL